MHADVNEIVYTELNKKWKDTCKIILGGEIGELKDYEKWLSDNLSPRTVYTDSKGREIVISVPHYGKNSRWISFDEVDFNKRYPPIHISSERIGEIESLLNAVRDRIYYTGNVVLGNSKFVDKSTGIFESYFVYHSERCAYCKYITHTTQATSCEYMFGCNGHGSTSFCIKTFATMYSSRCFECSKAEYCADCYYSHNLANCQHCFFCFNLKNKRYCIGNLQLSPEKYHEIKNRLLSEMREMLIRDKKLPSLLALCKTPPQNQKELEIILAKMQNKGMAERENAAIIEKAFADTAKLLFGKPYSQIDRYAKWLNQYTARLEDGKSCASGKRIVVPEHLDFHFYPRNRLLTEEEAGFIGEKLQISHQELERLSIKNAAEIISKIAYFCPNWTLGTVKNAIDAIINFESSNCYKNILNINSKYSAFGYWARDSEYVFGGNEVRNSSFCINCYHSAKLQRCFEVDASRNCSDCYYCHDIENCRDCMFCFNVKNLRYAIGNFEIGREKYLEIKKKVLEELNEELEKSSAIRLSIFRLLD
ncbi:MAG: hypothetical protein N3G22_01860 [Candidatus Micrarchaeota archaeon]|nr:hypothetical protein [Candidatus Micrarchaeota archaeon]